MKENTLPTISEQADYTEYNSLNEYEKRCLPATNYWREKNGKALIAVPPSDTHYYKYFKATVKPFNRILPQEESKINLPAISFFRTPISNIYPHSTVNIKEVYDKIKNPAEYKKITDNLRSYSFSSVMFSTYKAALFDYVTFSGTFKTRRDNDLIIHSGLLCLDLDNLKDVDFLKEQLKREAFTVLLFTSPGGRGLKWIINIDVKKADHRTQFQAISSFTQNKYGILPDQSGKDISRACFLAYDPEVYLNPSLIIND